RMSRARPRQRLFVRAHVLVPSIALVEVRRRELPVLRRIVQPFEEPAALFLFGDVEEELADERAVPRQVALESVDVLVSIAPQVFGDERCGKLLAAEDVGMDANHEYF